MKNHLTRWVVKVAEAKARAKESGQIIGDADLAEVITEKLESAGMKSVDRGAVNHWLKGRRQPNVSQFIALCDALKIAPADVIGSPRAVVRTLELREPTAAAWPPLSPEAEAIIQQIRHAEPAAQMMALTVAKAALDQAAPELRKPRTKNARSSQ